QDETEHDKHLKEVLKRMESVGLKLSKEKCVFKKTELSFLEHIVDAQGGNNDNRPQFISKAWRNFCDTYDIQHITSSPYNPQGNGHAEWAVQTAKRILKQDDPLLALMSFHLYRCKPSRIVNGKKNLHYSAHSSDKPQTKVAKQSNHKGEG
ncbi:hypothetical protein QTP70_034964, partial [Hemibagrus guttatus]